MAFELCPAAIIIKKYEEKAKATAPIILNHGSTLKISKAI
jgi:hypothetical protein